MKILASFAAAAAVLGSLAASPASATANSIPPNGVQIPAAQLSRIRNWYAPSDTALYLLSQARTWYKAELARPCWGMPQADRIRVNMTDGDRLDASSTVLVNHERCQVASVYRVDGPIRTLLVKPY